MTLGLVVTSGNLGFEFIENVRQIMGHDVPLFAVRVPWSLDFDPALEEIRQFLHTNRDYPVVIFTDMEGSTASNLAEAFRAKGKIEVITGVNIPMLLKFATMNHADHDTEMMCRELVSRGRSFIRFSGRRGAFP